MNYREIITKLGNAALQPDKTVAESMQLTGKEALGCFPIYTPEEIIYAAGYLPVGMWGGNTALQKADKYLQSFCCSIMRSNLEYGLKGTYHMLKGIALPTFCDTLKCLCENWKAAVPQIPVLPIVYPQHRQIEAGLSYMIEEFQRFQRELEKLSKCQISQASLNEAFDLYEEYRETMRLFVKVAADYPNIIDTKTRHLIIKAGYFLDKRSYIQDIRAIIKGLEEEAAEQTDKRKVIATGILSEPVELLELFDANQICIVGDDLAQESRQFRTEARQAGNVYEKMAYRMADQKGCTFLFEPEKTRGQMLIDMVKEQKADAVVIFMMKFCDPEEFDYPIYKKELEKAGIPMLYLEIEQQLNSFEQVRTRIQSFAEMLI